MYTILVVDGVEAYRLCRKCILRLFIMGKFYLIIVILRTLLIGAIAPSIDDLQNCSNMTLKVEEVYKCPRSESEYIRKAIKKGCHSSCQSKEIQGVYHCLRNSRKDKLVEVCSPIWKSAGYCVEYNEERKRVEDNYTISCRGFKPPCETTYPSNMVYKYPSCLRLTSVKDEINKQSGIFTKRVIIAFIAVIVSVALLVPLLIYCSYTCWIRRRGQNLLPFNSAIPLEEERHPDIRNSLADNETPV